MLLRIYKNYIKQLGIALSTVLFLFLLNPYNLKYFFGYAIIGFIIFQKKLLLKNLDSTFFLLFLFSIFYGLFFALSPANESSQMIVIYTLFPASFYLLGKYIYIKLNGNKTHLFYFLTVFGILYSITPLLSVLLNIKEGGFGQIDRNLPLFWNGQIASATTMGSFFTLNMCIPSLLLAQQEKRSWLFNTGSVIIFLLSLASALRIGSRTQLFVFIIILFFSLVYIIPKQSLKRNVITFLLFFIGLGFIAKNISFDLNQDWLSSFTSRMEKGGSEDIASGGGRSSRWAKSIEYIFKEPLGWDVHEFGYSHNMWFDVLRVSGVIPFTLLLIFSIKSSLTLKSAILRNKKNLSFNNQLLVYFIALHLVFMVEPIFDGITEMFLISCFLVGIIVMYRNEEKQIH